MRNGVAILAVLIGLWIFSPAQAQSTALLKTVSVEIWPEYDQQAILVIYHISLPADTTLPTTVNLRVPAQSEVFAVAVSDPTKGLLNTPYDRTVLGSWATLAITTNSPEIQVEYYDPLVKDGSTRHILYEWAGDYAVEAFSVALQQPIGATSLTTNPILANSNIGQDGFLYHHSETLSLSAGQSYTLQADYQKDTDTLSTTGLPVTPSQPLDSNTPGRITMNSVLPWILAGIGGALIVVGVVSGYYMWKSGTRHQSSPRKRYTPMQRAGEPIDIYCNQCGKRAQPGDVFCRTCGMRLRKEE